MTKLKLQETDVIVSRQVGDPVPDIAAVDPALGQYNFGDLSQFVEFSKVMCQAGEMLPAHAQKNPAICLAITMRAVHWGFDPFALALETYQAKQGGPIGYQAKVFTGVLRKAGVKLRYRYEGEIKMIDKAVKSHRGNEIARRTATGDRKCIAYAVEDGETLEYETMTLDDITIKNSPLWHNDPDQQLAYAAGRGWARRYRADLMMGAYSEDEVEQMRPMRDVTPKQTGFARHIEEAKAAQERAQEAKADPDPQGHPEDANGDPDAAQGVPDTETEDQSEPQYEIDPESPAFQLGVEAATEGFVDRGQSPLKDAEDQGQHINWLAGFDSVEKSNDTDAG